MDIQPITVLGTISEDKYNKDIKALTPFNTGIQHAGNN